ncbi:receptor-like protein 13 isoform X2 [Gossypium hirsutum]|uniref:Receptor-like protein 13 isoform X2 n=1 Tax=Gossypium hirsutum TaxID=3635 RepID=A0ABM2ZG71_GOSHI|nr:receptor-like protein 13 isoform X2 [Gossypium hirsutum]
MEYWKLVWLFVLAFLFGGYQTEACWEIEKAALFQLKPFFPHFDDVGNSWVEGNCCRWNWVECSTSTGRVTRLFLEYGYDRYNKDIYSARWYFNLSLFFPFKELKSLNLRGNTIAGFIHNQGTKRSSKLNKLKILDLSENKLLEKNILPYLAEFTSLKILLLENCGLQGSVDILQLNNIKNLKELYLSSNQIESLGSLFQNKEQLTLAKLEVLDLSYNYFNNSIFSSLAVLPYLKSLNIESNHLIEWSYIQDLNVLSNLKRLNMTYDGLNDSVLSQDNKKELKLMNLEELNLRGNVFNSSILSSLGSLSNLKSLSLFHIFSMEGSIDVRGLPALKYLEKLYVSCQSEYVAELQLQSLDIFPSLKTLSLEMFSLKGTIIIQRWQNLTNLKELTLRDLSHTSSIIQNIGTLTSLEDLVIDGCDIDASLNLHGFCELRQLQTLTISNTNWNASLPECFSELTSLKYLDLSSNNFFGNISIFNNLISLEYLDLSSNNFFENIFVFKNLISLEYLDLSSNKFFGDISLLKSLTSLQELRLSNNNIEILSSLAPLFNLSKLQNIYADNNMIYNAETEMHSLDTPTFQLRSITLSCCGDGGSFPHSLNHQHDLEHVDLSNINFKGYQFPNWLLENNKKLKELHLANSSLSGHFQLPPTSRRGLLYLDVSNNSLDGNIPNEIGAKLPSLKLLNMSINFFGGIIPISIGGMIFLQFLDLSNNKLSGGIPRHLPMGLVLFDVSNNQLFGDIPSSMENLSLMLTLDLSNNTLFGGIPRWMGKMSNLHELVMANNHFEGPIPMELCNLNYSLQFLDLSANNISGSLPSCFIFSRLTHVYLSRNKLKGPITSFLNSNYLVTLDLSNNHLTGNIPNWIGTLSTLVYLLLDNNHFEGGIPVQLCKLNRLRLIDVSNNNLSGTIPPCLMNSISNDSSHAYYSDYDYNGYIGSFSADVPVEVTMKSISYFYRGRVLTYLSGIDLSCNKLTGEIPLQFQTFRYIIVLNFSHNSLIGPIPPALSYLSRIESLDLSHNHLSGNIPSQLVGLHFLSFFSVAYNNLSGTTPQRTGQFATFEESSYVGNPFLCGEPLPKNCSTDGSSSSMRRNATDEGFLDIKVFYASFVGSYIVMPLCIAIVLYINPYWRQAWFYHVEAATMSCYYFVLDNTLPKRFR